MDKEKIIVKVTMLASAMLANDSTYRSSSTKSGATATQTFSTLTVVCCISWRISLLQVNVKEWYNKNNGFISGISVTGEDVKESKRNVLLQHPKLCAYIDTIYTHSPGYGKKIPVYESPNLPKIKFWSSLSFSPFFPKVKKNLISWHCFYASFASILLVTRNCFVKKRRNMKTSCPG